MQQEITLQLAPENWKKIKDGFVELDKIVMEDLEYFVEVIEFLECPDIKVRLTPNFQLQ